MKAPKKLRGGSDSELTKFKELWRARFTEKQRSFWRQEFLSSTPTAETRESLRVKTGIHLTDDNQLVRFRKWDELEQARELEAERMAEDEKFFRKEFGDAISPETLRQMVLGASYRRSLVTGNHELGLQTMRVDQGERSGKFKADLETAKLELKRQAEARAKEEFKLAREKFEFDGAKAALAHLPKLRAIAANKTISEADKVNQTRQILFGLLPK